MPNEVLLQFRCETQAAFDEVVANISEARAGNLRVNVTFEQQEGDRCEVYVPVLAEPFLAEQLVTLENHALSAEGVVPELVRAILAAPPENPILIGEYVDFLERKIDHLMVRSLNQHTEIQDALNSTALSLAEMQEANKRCEGLYAHLEQLGVICHFDMISKLGEAMRLHSGENPLEGYEGLNFKLH